MLVPAVWTPIWIAMKYLRILSSQSVLKIGSKLGIFSDLTELYYMPYL